MIPSAHDGPFGRRWTIVLLAAAGVNLAVGVWLFRHPSRSADLREMTRWAGQWLAGTNPYGGVPAGIDYPPWALVQLSPLAMLAPAGDAALRVVWLAVNLAALGCLVWQIARSTGEARDVRVRLMLVCLACASVRTLGQFSLLSFACAITAVLGPTRSWSGALLGFSLFKPHIGGVVLIWAALERRWRLVWPALAVPAVFLLVFCAHAGVTPGAAIAGYARSLQALHGGAEPFTGHTDLEPWIALIWPRATGPVANAITGAWLLVPVVAAAALGPARDGRARLERLGLCGAASLLAVRHLSYDFILLFPVLAAWRTWPVSADSRPRAERAAFVVLAALLIAEVPSLWRAFGGALGAHPAMGVILELDRALSLAVWIALSVIVLQAAWRRTPR
jgi:hypothetical protein